MESSPPERLALAAPLGAKNVNSMADSRPAATDYPQYVLITDVCV